MELRCWQCGVEPTDVAEVNTLDGAEPIRYIPTGWPAGGQDHEHALAPPTPSDLATSGDAALARLINAW